MKRSLKISIILNIILLFCALVLILNKLGMLYMSDIRAVIGQMMPFKGGGVQLFE